MDEEEHPVSAVRGVKACIILPTLNTGKDMRCWQAQRAIAGGRFTSKTEPLTPCSGVETQQKPTAQSLNAGGAQFQLDSW